MPKPNQTQDESQSSPLVCTTCVPAEFLPTRSPKKSAKIIDFAGFWSYFWAMPVLKIVLPGFFLLIVTFFMSNWRVGSTWVMAAQILALPLAGWMVFKNGYLSIFKEHNLNMNVLMSLAVIGAVVINETHEALIMLILFTISEALEGYTGDSARKVLSEFADMAPKTAILLREGRELTVKTEDLQVGDVILIRAGDRFPMDGKVVRGSSEVNQAPITGESKLVFKEVGGQVLSGSVNGMGNLEVEVTCLAEDTTIQRIINLVTEAQENKAKQEKFIDRFAAIYTPIILVAAILVATIPTILFGQAFWNVDGSYGWFHRALSLLMIGCPCALLISTPITIISGLTRAARAGIVFKGGVFLESLSQMKVVAFDKTGTLTKGTPVVNQVKAVDCEGGESCEPCADLLALAGSLEQHSQHPLGLAVVEEADSRGLLNRYAPAQSLQVLQGQGQQGYVNGKLATVGSLPLFLAEHHTPAKVVTETQLAESSGLTTMLVCDGERVRGYITLEDAVRPEAASVIKELKTTRIHTVMLTGDNFGAAEKIGQYLGLDEIHAGLLPDQKLSKLAELRQKYGYIAMVGDGINDSPALARADLGVGMGGAGNAQVLETADIVLMNDNLERLPFAFHLSEQVNKLIKQNIVISLGTKFFVAIFALLGLTPLWVAVLADIGVSLAVTLNGLRAARFEWAVAEVN